MIESPRDTLIVGTTDSVATNLDPAETYASSDMGIILNIGASLVYSNPDPVAGSENLRPGLATRWSVKRGWANVDFRSEGGCEVL